MMNATHKMIARVQSLLMAGSKLRTERYPHARRFYRRIERIETYLIARFNRDDSPEEADVFQLAWPSIEVGGEG